MHLRGGRLSWPLFSEHHLAKFIAEAPYFFRIFAPAEVHYELEKIPLRVLLGPNG